MTGESNCKCLTDGPQRDWSTEDLGETKSYGEVCLRTCSICGSRWLSYFYEHEAFTASDRSYIGYLGSLSAPNPDDAIALMRMLEPRFIWDKKKVRWVKNSGAVIDGL